MAPGSAGPTASKRPCRSAPCNAWSAPAGCRRSSSPRTVKSSTSTSNNASSPTAQRKAIIARDGGCVIPGCTSPPGWAEMHHVIPWQHRGTTNVNNGVALCWYHHHTIDTSGWLIRILDGAVQVKAPPWLGLGGRLAPRQPTPRPHHPRPVTVTEIGRRVSTGSTTGRGRRQVIHTVQTAVNNYTSVIRITRKLNRRVGTGVPALDGSPPLGRMLAVSWGSIKSAGLCWSASYSEV